MASVDFPLCESCLQGHIIPGEPQGEMKKIADLDCYVATPIGVHFMPL